MVTRLFRRRLATSVSTTQMLRDLRDETALVALVGAWHGGRSVVGFDPAHRLPDGVDPFAAIGRLPRVDEPTGAGGFGGGWLGILGYPLGGLIEDLPPSPPRPVPGPPAILAYYDHVLVRDDDTWWFEALVDEQNADRVARCLCRVEALVEVTERRPAAPYTCGDLVATPHRDGHGPPWRPRSAT